MRESATCFEFGWAQRLLRNSSTQRSRQLSNACTALWSSDSWLAVKPCMVRNSEEGGLITMIYTEGHVTVTRWKFAFGFLMINFKRLKCCGRDSGRDIILEEVLKKMTDIPLAKHFFFFENFSIPTSASTLNLNLNLKLHRKYIFFIYVLHTTRTRRNSTGSETLVDII